MVVFSEKRSNPKRFRLEYIWIGFLIFYLVFLGIRGAWHQHRLYYRYHKLLQQIEQAKEQNIQLKSKIARLQDPRYLEFLARDRLGLVKPGEKVYKLIESEGGAEK